jgi:hypothetical protein
MRIGRESVACLRGLQDTVFALCPENSFLAKTKFLKDAIRYKTFTYSRSKLIYLRILHAIIHFKPDLIIPGDEDTILALQNVASIIKHLPFLNSIYRTIRKSLADEKFDHLVLSKSDLQQKCIEWGVRTPKNKIVKTSIEACEVAKQIGYPVVIKHDSGYGGSGVVICDSEEVLLAHFKQIENVSLLAKIKAHIKDMLFVSILRPNGVISIQQFIKGEIGQSPFCAFNGEVIATNPMQKVHTYPGKTGPSSVLKGIEDKDIENFVKIIAKNLNYNGFGSVDYMISEDNQLLHVIELNPRPTPTCHMQSNHVTNDLCEAFACGLKAIPYVPKKFWPFTVAMFPGEKKRDPKSPYLTNSYHDIPVDDPELEKALDR